jgi:hypothetical protein
VFDFGAIYVVASIEGTWVMDEIVEEIDGL